MTDPADHKSFFNSEYISDFESDAQSQVGSLGSSSVEDDNLSTFAGSKRSYSSCDKISSRKIPDQIRRGGAQAVLQNAYQRHQKMVNDYLMYYGGSHKDFLRDTSSDRRDIDVVKANNRFMWSEEDAPQTWEERLAKRYWDRLFKEYCMADLSRYKEKKLGLRWRSKREVASGKGQFVCGALSCTEAASLRSWEVNFAYTEKGSRRNALVKLRLCPRCSDKLNHHKQYTEHVPPTVKTEQESGQQAEGEGEQEDGVSGAKQVSTENQEMKSSAWKSSAYAEEKTAPSEDAFEDYFKDMFM